MLVPPQPTLTSAVPLTAVQSVLIPVFGYANVVELIIRMGTPFGYVEVDILKDAVPIPLFRFITIPQSSY